MKLILDTADTTAIRYYNDYLALDGVTTNPTIITKSGKPYVDVLKEIVEILDEDQALYVQAVSEDYEGIVEDAKWLSTLGKKNIYIKIPVTNEGLKAIKTVHKLGIKILATAIYSMDQAYLAMHAGADALAPYVNRMCYYGNGVDEVINMQTIIDNYGYNTEIVAASFKNASQVRELMLNGIGACTVPVDVMAQLFNNENTNNAVKEFTANWEKTYGKKTLR
ncbi:MAG: fructose-6-phosphate aldolase [Holdemanella sp.]|nr:fructose-6-phosphate aldolase [Holdemanella sp.]